MSAMAQRCMAALLHSSARLPREGIPERDQDHEAATTIQGKTLPVEQRFTRGQFAGSWARAEQEGELQEGVSDIIQLLPGY